MKKEREIILFILILLICTGIIMIYSSSAVYSYDRLGMSHFFFKRHLIYVFLGLVAFMSALAISYEKLQKLVPVLLIVSFFLLVLVMIPGVGFRVGGGRRWIDLGFFRFQPSEIAKVCIIIYLADFLSRKKKLITDFKRGILPPLFICLSTAGLIFLQPDLGNALFLIGITLIILFIAGMRLKHIFCIVLASLPFLYFFILSVAYRRNRIIAFLNPWSFPQGIGFQLVQSYLAFGSGGIFGVGLGQSRQKLFYLPASHTDFVFSIIGEEIGFFGTFFVIALFIILFIYGFKIASSKNDIFARMLSIGIIVNITLQTIINIAVTTGMLPTKGLPLPFISYGGTNLVVSMFQIGLLINISKNAI